MKAKLMAMILAAGAMLGARAATEIVDGIEWNYNIVDGEATIIKGIGYYEPAIPKETAGAITIPSTLGGRPVTIIGQCAFWDCYNLTGVTIPFGVKHIAVNAFDGCIKLPGVTIPASVTTIDGAAFADCDAIESMTIPSSVTVLRGGLFLRCHNLKSVTLKGAIKDLPAKMYYMCENLAYAPIPNSVTNIGEFAFYATDISSVTIPAGVTVIGNAAFYSCLKLTSISFPSGLKSIGSSAFYNCSSITGNITIPDGVKTIEGSAFRGCSSIESVTIPSGVTAIERYAFSACKNLVSVEIPAGVTRIGMYAFESCEKLASATIPAGVTRIEKGVFNTCRALTSIVIPSGVTSIGERAFYQCTHLSFATIPSAVTEIGENAFTDTALATVRTGVGNTDRLRALLEASGCDTSAIAFIEESEGVNLGALTGNVTVKDGEAVWGTLAGNRKVSIADGATVTLKDVAIEGANNEAYPWAGITCEGDATILLIGDNVVQGFHEDYPGIHVPANKTLTIRGSGSLVASSNGLGAGIGAGRLIDCGNIVIEGGTVTATGGYRCAGIGGGNGGNCGFITISGGTVTANGGKDAAAIGGGYQAACGAITIGGGITKVVANRDKSSVTDHIGHGKNGTGGAVTLSGGLVDETSSDTRTIVPSSSRWNGNLSTLTADAVAHDGLLIYGTLSGKHKITIADGATVRFTTVIIEGSDDAACPWAGLTCEGNATIVLDGHATIRGFHKNYPGIYVPPNKTLTIQGQGNVSLTASSNGKAAGIGAGYELSCGKIVINGGTITATGGYEAAGIGGAWKADNGKITIGAGIVKVVATAGDNDAEPIGRGCAGESSQVCVDESLSDETIGLTRTIKPAQYCMVTFNANGGDGGTSRSVKKGYPVGTLPVATRDGWSFDGWFNSSSGGSQISVSTVINGTITYFAHWTENPNPPDPGTPTASFGAAAVAGGEGGVITVVVNGGRSDAASGVKVYLTYNTAVAADLDLAKGTVNDVTPKGGLKFPLALAWEAGDTTSRTVVIPTKADKTVEDSEIFTLQLAETSGLALGENRLCTAYIHDPGYDELAAKIAAGTATTAEQTAWNKLQVAKVPYIRGLADNADGGKVTGSGLCAEGKKVTLKATANKNFTFLGWKAASKSAPYLPTGDYVATTASLVIDRTAKPAANTKTSTTIAGVTADTTYYAVFESFPEVTIAVSATDASGATPTGKGAGKYVAGTVTGMGKYAPGKKVTVKATAAKSATTTYVHSGWYNGETLLSRAASYTFEMPAGDVALTAKFITATEDAAGVSAVLDGTFAYDAGTTSYATDVPAGVYLEWPLAVVAQSQTTVAVSGLPSGLKFTAKDIVDSKTKLVTIPANTIYGVPTAASKTDKNTGKQIPSNVKIKMTTAGKTKVEYTLALTVTPMAAWAVGTFDGGGDAGQLTLTVAATGKISGKYIGVDGKTWTLSAANFYELDESTPLYSAEILAKSGKETSTFTLEIGVNEKMEGCGIAEIRDEKDAILGNLYQTNWKADPWKGIAGKIAKAKPYEYPAKDEAGNIGTITLKFAASGKVTAKGVFGSNAASCSTVIVPLSNPDSNESSGFCIYVCLPQKGKFAGYCGSVDLNWNGTSFEFK